MNKKYFVAPILPALLLDGCFGYKPITKEIAAEIATNIYENQPGNRYYRKIYIKSKSRLETNISNNTHSIENEEYFLFSETDNYLHYSNPLEKVWAFMLDDYFYYLHGNEGVKFIPRKNKTLFDCFSRAYGNQVTIDNLIANTDVYWFNYTLNDIRNGKDFNALVAVDNDGQPIENSTIYYSTNNKDHLRIEQSQTFTNANLVYKNIESASGEAKVAISWEKSKPALANGSCSFSCFTYENNQRIPLDVAYTYSTTFKFDRFDLCRPDLSSFHIKETHW